jgi:hypothetical protein
MLFDYLYYPGEHTSDIKNIGIKDFAALRLVCRDIYTETSHPFDTRFFAGGTKVVLGPTASTMAASRGVSIARC